MLRLRFVTLVVLSLAILHADAAKKKKKRSPLNLDQSEKLLGREMIYRASQGDSKAVIKLLEHGIPADKYKDARNSTALMKAATARSIPTMEALLDADAEIDHQNKPGWSALMLAVKSLEPAAVKMLIQRGANMDLQDKKHYSALMHAASQGGNEQYDQTVLLLNAGADFWLKDAFGWTALDYAEEGGYAELSALLKQYIKIPKDEQMDDRVKEIYDISIIPNKIWFPENLTRAIEILNDKTQAVDADEYGDGKASRALQKAALRGNTALVKAIIESTKGVDINHGSAPQDSGAQNEENMEIQDGFTALLLATAGGHLDTMKLLVSKGADVNKCDRMGKSPLYWAGNNGRTEAVKILLDAGADPLIYARTDRTPLENAKITPHKKDALLEILEAATAKALADGKERRQNLPMFYQCTTIAVAMGDWTMEQVNYCCERYGLGCIRMPSIQGDSRRPGDANGFDGPPPLPPDQQQALADKGLHPRQLNDHSGKPPCKNGATECVGADPMLHKQIRAAAGKTNDQNPQKGRRDEL